MLGTVHFKDSVIAFLVVFFNNLIFLIKLNRSCPFDPPFRVKDLPRSEVLSVVLIPDACSCFFDFFMDLYTLCAEN